MTSKNRNNNGNTAETVKEGCGCLFVTFLIGIVIIVVIFAFKNGWI